MDSRRRTFLVTLVPAAFLAGTVIAEAQTVQRPPRPQPTQPPQPLPPPEPEEPEEGAPFKADPRAVLKQNQQDIKRDVQRLFELAEELKKEVEKTDTVEVLSIPLLRKVEEIERLARHIRNMARG